MQHYENREYVKSRDKLIPIAENIANAAHGSNPRDKDAEDWSRAFHAEMNRLVHEFGLLNNMDS
jgi:hypothetical protein